MARIKGYGQIFLSLFLLVVWTSPAQASLIGDTVFCDYTGSSADDGCSRDSATVEDEGSSPGGELFLSTSNPDGTLDEILLGIDIDDASVTLSSVLFSGTFDGTIKLTDLDWVGTDGRITDVTIGANSVTGIGANDIDFGDHSLAISLTGSEWKSESAVTFSLVTEHGVPVPLPSTLILSMLGLFGVALGLHRR